MEDKQRMYFSVLRIPVSEIYPHPDNPRKDLGDISELTESIKKNGLMQNLTVIPGHHVAKEGWSEKGYTLIIGHRRFAAAKAAGLNIIPCRILRNGLSHREQVAVMLEENMQRNDLTIREQGQGFQMMLDLGDTVQGIKDKTGFSETTIYHRLNIAKLDQGILQEKEDSEFQLSLKDMYELEKVKNIETRNEILKDCTNSENLRWRCLQAAKEEVIRTNWKNLKATFDEMGLCESPVIHVIYDSKYRHIMEIDLSKELPELPLLDTLNVTWLKRYDNKIVLLELCEVEEENEEEENEKDYDTSSSENQKPKEVRDDVKLDEMVDALKQEMMDFIRNIERVASKDALTFDDNIQTAWETILNNGYECSMENIVAFLLDTNRWKVTEEQNKEYRLKRQGIPVLREYLYIIAYEGLDNNYQSIANRSCEYDDGYGQEIMDIYNLLKNLGFSASSEEYIKAADGTHELYKEEENINEDND